jgi:hypothetical protein
MHYRIPNLKLNILGLEAFTSRFPKEIVALHPTSTLEITAASLPPSMQVIALQPAANS